MLIKQEDIVYLEGRDYSNSIDFTLKSDLSDYDYRTKIGFLENIVKDKNILHVGCVDHNIESIEKKIIKNKWLHGILDHSAKQCIGIDIKTKEIQILKEKYNFEVYSLDITQNNQPFESRKFDYLLLPDVLEHIGNPVEFLQNINRTHSNNIDKIIVTVPNAFYHKIFKKAASNIEEINSDHRFWFTPYTITKVLIDSGFEVERIFTYDKVSKEKNPTINKIKNTRVYKFIRNLFYGENIFTKNGIVVIAKFNKQ